VHRSRAIIASALAALLLLASVSPALGATRAELEKHRRAAEEARRRAAAAEKLAGKLAGEVSALDKRIEALQREADAMDPDIAKATKRTNGLAREVAVLRLECAETESRIASTQAEYDRQSELLADRVNSSYRQGDWFYLDMLLGSADINDLIARTELVSRVIESNNNVAAQLDDTKQALARDKVKLDRSLKAVSLKKREAEAIEDKLRGLRAAQERKAAQQEAVQVEKANLMRSSRKNARKLRALAEQEEAESDRIAAELGGNGSGHFAGSMAWPVPSSHRITSPFGMRICPFHGRELHPGIDIGRATAGGPSLMGASIVAAGAGRVMYAGYRGGYGNTVIIDHGNGVATLYAHQSAIRVRSGQKVSKGQRIGSVGSTGNSTGPHLHFEVRVNGQPKNPLSYR
jgi:murein DD-endopeptidase MepM/ murein hydrolase activator NlpD